MRSPPVRQREEMFEEYARQIERLRLETTALAEQAEKQRIRVNENASATRARMNARQ